MKRWLLALLFLPLFTVAANAQLMQCRVDDTPPTVSEGTTAPLYCTTTGTLVTSAAAPVGQATEAKQDVIISHVDGIEALIGTTNTNTSTTNTNLTTIDGRVDGLETLIGTTNTTLSTIDGRVDGIEALIGTTNTTLSTIDGRVDGLEASVDGLEGSVDGIEAVLATIDTSLNNLEAAQATAVAPDPSAAVEANSVLKASAGTLYGFQVTSGASAGYVMLYNATSAPADGAVTPVKCYVLPANTSMAANYSPPLSLSTGITVGFSTTGCFTKTASSTAFISGEYQ